MRNLVWFLIFCIVALTMLCIRIEMNRTPLEGRLPITINIEPDKVPNN